MQNPYRNVSRVNPQRENGDRRIETEVYRHLIKAKLSGSEYQCILYIIEKTWGYGKVEDRISVSQFQKATSLSRRGTINALNSLTEKRIILRTVKPGTINYYMVNKFYDTWTTGELQCTSAPQCTSTSAPQFTSTGAPECTYNSTTYLLRKGSEKTASCKNGKPALPTKRTGSDLVKYFCAIYKHFNNDNYVPSWAKDGKILKDLYQAVKEEFFPLAEHYMNVEADKTFFFSTKPRTIANFRTFINDVKDHRKKYA